MNVIALKQNVNMFNCMHPSTKSQPRQPVQSKWGVEKGN